ncbi:MAG: hypothetical protein ACYDCL_08310 [Myxococcales bacterium]
MGDAKRQVLVFADSKSLLACYVADGPGQLFAPLPGPPEPGTFEVGRTLPLTLAFRDRELRIPVRCRVIAVRDDGDGHWKVQLELVAGAEGGEQGAGSGWRPSARGPVRVRVTLGDGRQLDAVARSIRRETLDLDVTLPEEATELVKLSIRPPGRLLPIRLIGEPRPGGTGGSRIAILFRQPREELIWAQLAQEAVAHPSRLQLA